MGKKNSEGVDRRAFLAGIGAAGAATAAVAAATPAPAEAARPTTLPPVSASRANAIAALEETPPATGAAGGWSVDPYHVDSPGSDYMVDVMMALGYKYVAAMPGTTFRGLQESVLNHGIDKMEWITTVHEEISGSLAHGYAKASGKPMAIMVHNTVGLQHATMAIYNCFADRVPMLVMLGNYSDGALRVGGADWYHAATDDAAMCRGYIKYDEQPGSLEHYKESMLRGHGLMMTAPMGPMIMVCDQALQENTQSRKPQAPERPYVAATMPTADPNAIHEIAKILVAAQNPVIVVDRATRSQAGVLALVALAEALQAPVVDKLGRMNFPTNHYLNATPAVVPDADVLLALDVGDLFSTVNALEESTNRLTVRRAKPDCKVITIDSQLLVGAGNYQDKQRFFQADMPVAGDSEATLPFLLEAVKSEMSTARRNENPQREAKLRAAFHLKRSSDLTAAAIGWDDSPISVPRLCMDLWNQIKHAPWSLVSQSGFQSSWQNRLWDMTEHSQYLGGSGAAGIGYIGGAAVGAALAHKGDGTLCVSIQGDGDLMVGPGAMWTAAHHRIPLLTIVHNNRAWHQETMSVQIMASRRGRHPERGRIGTIITDPNIDYAKVAQGFGVYSEGPITQASDLSAALARAIKVVRGGEPALLDVVTQPR
jgi:thiamine pyrophosphate-dependent acetolactate synthase large subunit-like protein